MTLPTLTILGGRNFLYLQIGREKLWVPEIAQLILEEAGICADIDLSGLVIIKAEEQLFRYSPTPTPA